MGTEEAGGVLVLRPDRKAFSQPFTKFVSNVLAAHPGVPVFKVVPPRGYQPRRHAYPPLEDVTIGVPIKQHVRSPVCGVPAHTGPFCARAAAGPFLPGACISGLPRLHACAPEGQAASGALASAHTCALGGLRMMTRRGPPRERR